VVRKPILLSWLSNTIHSNDDDHPWIMGFDLLLGCVQ
jgi:hypothetical protein